MSSDKTKYVVVQIRICALSCSVYVTQIFFSKMEKNTCSTNVDTHVVVCTYRARFVLVSFPVSLFNLCTC